MFIRFNELSLFDLYNFLLKSQLPSYFQKLLHCFAQFLQLYFVVMSQHYRYNATVWLLKVHQRFLNSFMILMFLEIQSLASAYNLFGFISLYFMNFVNSFSYSSYPFDIFQYLCIQFTYNCYSLRLQILFGSVVYHSFDKYQIRIQFY